MKRATLAVSASIFGAAVLLVVALGESGVFRGTEAEDLDRYLESRLDSVGAPGLAAGIARADGLVWEGYYGTRDGTLPVTADTLFMIASVSKTVVAAAAMQLWEEGRFGLDDDIAGYLDFPVRNPHHPAAAVSFRQLMTHRSSIADREPLYTGMYTIDAGGGDSSWDLGSFLRAYLAPDGAFYDEANYLREAPGGRFEYSNYGTALLAYLVERLSGKKFSTYCRDRIFRPLGMERSFFLCAEIPDGEPEIAFPFVSGSPAPLYGYPDYPAGSLKTTVGDLAKFASFFLSKGRSRTDVLEPRTIETMFGEYGESDDLGERAMGLLWVHMDWIFLNAIGHTGSDPGASAFMLLYPDEGFASLLVMNANPFMERNPFALIAQRSILERLHREGRLRALRPDGGATPQSSGYASPEGADRPAAKAARGGRK